MNQLHSGHMYNCAKEQTRAIVFNNDYVRLNMGINNNFSFPPSRPLGCAEADDVLRKCEHVLEVLDQRDEELFLEWTEGLEEVCQTHLVEPLLTVNAETGLYQVNFSPAVRKERIHFHFVINKQHVCSV